MFGAHLHAADRLNKFLSGRRWQVRHHSYCCLAAVCLPMLEFCDNREQSPLSHPLSHLSLKLLICTPVGSPGFKPEPAVKILKHGPVNYYIAGSALLQYFE